MTTHRRSGRVPKRLSWPAIIAEAKTIVEGYDTDVTLRQLFYRLVAKMLIQGGGHGCHPLDARLQGGEGLHARLDLAQRSLPAADVDAELVGQRDGALERRLDPGERPRHVVVLESLSCLAHATERAGGSAEPIGPLGVESDVLQP
jgi:hypothetical protein